MSNAQIEEIRARDKFDNPANDEAEAMQCMKDRATLLAEVDRLNERLALIALTMDAKVIDATLTPKPHSSQSESTGDRPELPPLKPDQVEYLDRIRNATEGKPCTGEGVVTDEMVEAAATAMQNAVIRDDEGEFPRLFDLLDFGGENKARTVTRGLAKAAISAMMRVAQGEKVSRVSAPIAREDILEEAAGVADRIKKEADDYADEYHRNKPIAAERVVPTCIQEQINTARDIATGIRRLKSPPQEGTPHE